jgi:hypothetical protein
MKRHDGFTTTGRPEQLNAWKYRTADGHMVWILVKTYKCGQYCTVEVHNRASRAKETYVHIYHKDETIDALINVVLASRRRNLRIVGGTKA